MHRREFLRGAAIGVLGSAAFRSHSVAWADTPPRVGLIGTGWYGKCDLFRLIQVAPVEVVSLCDVDKQMLADAAAQVAARQASKKKPRTYGDYRDDAQGAGPRHRADRHARPLARADSDRGDARPAPISTCRSRSASMSSRVRRCWPPHASTNASCRSARSDAARRISCDARDRIIREGKLGKIGLVEIYCYYAHADPRAIRPTARRRRHSITRCGPGPAPMRPYNRAGAPARVARLHGIRQRHHRRHVHPHARHGALDARPRHGRRESARPAASSWTRPARRISPTRRRRRSTFPGSAWSGRTALRATRRIRSTRGA